MNVRGIFIDMSCRAWLWRYFLTIAVPLFFVFTFAVPYSFWWLYESGDAAMERAVQAQNAGEFAVFGSGLSQDFVDYKLRLYEAVKPEIIAIGSSRVMQFRGAWFKKSFLNMGGVAGNLAVLRSTVDALLTVSRPHAVIIGLDFWWFLPQWEKNPEEYVPPTSGSYNYSLDSLKKPWTWLLEGKISVKELFAPILGLFGTGFKVNRYGIMAQQTSDGFGPDGSWYYTAEICGLKQPFDYQFADTLKQIEYGIKAFYYASPKQDGPSEQHIDAFADIWCKLRSRGIKTFVFIPPVAPEVYAAIRRKGASYPHLFKLKEALADRGIEVVDFCNPAILSSSNCEFVDGFHGGEVTYARILREMSDRWPALLQYVNMEKLNRIIRQWQGHALVADERLTQAKETDFMNFGCKKHATSGAK